MIMEYIFMIISSSSSELVRPSIDLKESRPPFGVMQILGKLLREQLLAVDLNSISLTSRLIMNE